MSYSWSDRVDFIIRYMYGKKFLKLFVTEKEMKNYKKKILFVSYTYILCF